MEKLKNFYQSFSKELWMLFLTLVEAGIFCLVLHNDPSATIWFGGTLIYGIALLFILFLIKPTLTYAGFYCWIICSIIAATVMIVWGLHIVNHLPAWKTIVFVLLWAVVFCLFGILNMAVFTKEEERKEQK